MLRFIHYEAGGFMDLHYDDNIEYNNLVSKYTV
jgi:hypothetical protein